MKLDNVNYKPFVSIVVLNYNGRDCIVDCLDSLENQTYKNREIIVVDNASTDGSFDIVKRFFPEIILLKNKRNLGFAAGNNIGIRESKGDFIALFNNDAVADKDWLSRLVDALATSLKAGISGGPVYCRSPRNAIWSQGARIDLVTGYISHLELYDTKSLSEEGVDFFPLCAVLVKKEMFDKVGLLNERFFLYSEDVDFCLKVKGKGYELILVPDAKVWHGVSRDHARISCRIMFQRLVSEFKLILMGWPTWCLHLTIFTKLLVMPLVYVIVYGYSSRYISLTWYAFFRALSSGKRCKRHPDDFLPLRVRLGEFLKERIRNRSNPSTYGQHLQGELSPVTSG